MRMREQRHLLVTQGIGGDDGYWFTVERKPNGALRRVCSRALPYRMTRDEAERDLAIWLAAKMATGGFKAQQIYGATYEALRLAGRGR